MKKYIKLLAILSMMIWSGQVLAQNHGNIFFGASLPMNDFGKYFDHSGYVLQSSEGTDGGATIGINAGFKWNFSVGVRGLSVMLSVDCLYNGLCEELKSYYQGIGDEEREIYTQSYKMYTPKYINVPAMLGMNYTYYFNPQFGIFAEAGAGVNCRFITDYERIGIARDFKDIWTDHCNPAYNFAYQAGAGFEFGKALTLSCSFYDLGLSPVKMTQTHKNVVNEHVTNEIAYKDCGVLHPIMILGRIGFRF